MRRLILLLLVVMMFDNTNAQYPPIPNTFRVPLDIPLYLSGNFAELRTDHFHSGIDIKTQGVTGKEVHAIEDGYVSRIKIQTNGYGRSLYINYPGGYTSVFGHLSAYDEQIDQYVKSYQYRNHVHEVDIYPSPGELPVKKGEVVALSGNSGSSGGPHLHFEIRSTAKQYPQNVLRYGFPIKDNVPPRLYSLFVYGMNGDGKDRVPVSRREYDLSGENGVYRIKAGNVIASSLPVGLGIECYDYLNGSSNRCGIYSLEVFVNGKAVYHFQTDQFSFAESRYINAHTDYSLKALTRRRTHDLFREPGERLSMNKLDFRDGIIPSQPGHTDDIRIVAQDAYGNKSSLEFKLMDAGLDETTDDTISENNTHHFKWYQVNDFSNRLMHLTIPEGSLYENTDFSYSYDSTGNSFYPYIHHIHSEEVPLQKYSTLTMGAGNIPERLLSKTGIVYLPAKGSPEWEGGEVKSGRITTGIREFGNYTLEADTLPPVIKPLNINPGKDMRNTGSIRFRIKDELSGIATYEGYIDNSWVLFEYDPKNDMLYYRFDPVRFRNSDHSHELELYVDDNTGNTAIYHTTFYR